MNSIFFAFIELAIHKSLFQQDYSCISTDNGSSNLWNHSTLMRITVVSRAPTSFLCISINPHLRGARNFLRRSTRRSWENKCSQLSKYKHSQLFKYKYFQSYLQRKNVQIYFFFHQRTFSWIKTVKPAQQELNS